MANDVLPNAFKGNLEGFLSKLDKVKPTGTMRWKACCPAHDDSTPSLAVRELPDGRILIHCFAGCDVYEILKAVNMEIDDLFPEGVRPLTGKQDFYPAVRLPVPAQDILSLISQDAILVSVYAQDMANGQMLSPEGIKHLRAAAARIIEAAKFGKW